MFKNVENNLRKLKGSYRKLKSYYYYNKNFLFLREKVAEFEYDREKMEETFRKMAEVLSKPNAGKSKEFIESLLGEISFYAIPKKFDNTPKQSGIPVSNILQHNKKIKTVNFFIDAPIELHILDTLWTIYLAKMDKDNRVLSFDVYGNTINKSALFGDGDDIFFDNRNLFNRYFERYTAWRNKAFDALEKNYDSKKDSVLISLDIKSFFYSVNFNFENLNYYFSQHAILQQIRGLTKIMQKVYACYEQVIKPYRKDLEQLKRGEYPLPIGLFSSMLLGNIFLKDIDRKIKQLSNVSYYGRYVDDILLVINKTISLNDSNDKVIEDVFVQNGILRRTNSQYEFVGYKSLCVQAEKIKILFVNHLESRAIIDIYNDTIRVIPSQADPIPAVELDLVSLPQMIYNVENFNKESKIRDIGGVGIDSFKVGRFFALLPRRYAHVNTLPNDIRTEISTHISQIEEFFTGSQMLEYYSNWLNYMYFLVITRSYKQLRSFAQRAKAEISSLKSPALDRNIFKRGTSINKRVKETLLQHLEICLSVALAVDMDIAKNHFAARLDQVKKYMEANMFEHSFVALPLANYLEYKDYVSYSKMSLADLGKFPEGAANAFKFMWSPRFIHFDELSMLLFYYYHSKKGAGSEYLTGRLKSLVERFSAVNYLPTSPFEIKTEEIFFNKGEYLLEQFTTPPSGTTLPKKINIAVGSIDIAEKDCIKGYDRWKNITIAKKSEFVKILQECHACAKMNPHEHNPTVIVFPELYVPVYWLNDLIRFSKRSQIAVVTGLQYINGYLNQKHNYLATIIPFKSGTKGYRNAFAHIREKNDYSPIELKELAKRGLYCKNPEKAEYQVFHWNGMRIAPILCFELTDIVARALLKGNSDIIAASVFNRDTQYFSNIIDSAARDLHAFIVQANTSHLGDSRITGPYDRDSKDIFKIKGGYNDHIVIGTVEYEKLKLFQQNYLKKQEGILQKAIAGKRVSAEERKRKKPDIKPLPARFKPK